MMIRQLYHRFLRYATAPSIFDITIPPEPPPFNLSGAGVDRVERLVRSGWDLERAWDFVAGAEAECVKACHAEACAP